MDTLKCGILIALAGCVSFSTVSVGLEIGPAGHGLVAKLLAVEVLHWFLHVWCHPVTSVFLCKYEGCYFLGRTTFIMSVVVVVLVYFIHFDILEASSTSSSRSSYVIHDGTPIMICLPEGCIRGSAVALLAMDGYYFHQQLLGPVVLDALLVLFNFICNFTPGYFM